MAKSADTMNPDSKKCSVEGCDRPYSTMGFCKPHYDRNRRKGGDVVTPIRPRYFAGTCRAPNCDKASKSGCAGYCQVHRARLRIHGSFELPNRTPPGTYTRFIKECLEYRGGDCVIWPWKRSISSGYPHVNFDGYRGGAHRLICILAHGDPPFACAQAAHLCGNSLCLNPGHLRWATSADNLADRVEHGTLRFGEQQHNAKLTDEAVRFIRGSDLTSYRLALKFGVAKSTIKHARSGRNWKHVI